MRRWRRRLAALLLGCALSLVAGEIAVRLLDRRSAPQRHFRPGIYAADPEVGWVLLPSYRGVHAEYEFEAPTTTNALGFRGPEWDEERASARERVLVLGDSCAFGRGVADPETFPAQLESRLAERRPTAVFNAGVPGYDTVQEEALMPRVARIVRPTVVVVVWLPNDVLERSVDVRKVTQVLDGQLIDDPARYAAWKDEIEGRGLSRSALYRFLRVSLNARRLRERMPGRASSDGATPSDAGLDDESLRYSQEPLRRIAASARALGARSLLVLLPRKRELEEPGASTVYERMESFGRKAGMEVVNVNRTWRAAAPDEGRFLSRDDV
ncbi:hypothetical protein HY251_13280, partial [bacterium]|nr:hypothetical protein [bacterium]